MHEMLPFFANFYRAERNNSVKISPLKSLFKFTKRETATGIESRLRNNATKSSQRRIGLV